MNPIKRPKVSETEDDLLKQQQEFLAQTSHKKDDDKKSDAEIENKNESVLADAHDVPKIICNIIERDVNNYKFTPNINRSADGFPKAIRRNVELDSAGGRQSIFARQFGRRKETTRRNFSETKFISNLVSGEGLGVENWKNEIEKIKQENDKTINEMDENEINEMRNELLNKLDPKVIEFLQKKTSSQTTKSQNKKQVTFDLGKKDSTEKRIEDVEMKEVEMENILPFTKEEIEKNKWINMDLVEKEKLEWIGDLPENKIIKTEESSARFNFKGELIAPNTDVPTQLGLHHHGEEQSLAGYTVNELLTFLQSSFPAQKLIGFQVLAKIFQNAYKGLFDGCFNENLIEQLLSKTPFILVVRLGLDDNAETIWKSAINCLHSIICNTQFDELCLDRAFPLLIHSETGLKPKNEITDVDEINDEKFASIDVILCLIKRTDLLQRIRYLIEILKQQMDVKTIDNLLDILIRIARHSNESRTAILRCPYLIEFIINNFVPCSIQFTDSIYHNPNCKAIKLIRIICNDNDLARELLYKHSSILDSLKVYLTLDPQNSGETKEILQISIESLRTWTVLLRNNIATESLMEMFPIVIKQLQFCLTINCLSHENSFDWHYVSTLLTTLKFIQRQTHGFNELINSILFQWITQIRNSNLLPNFECSLAIWSAIQFVLSTDIQTNLLEQNVIKQLTNLTKKILVNLIENSSILALSQLKSGKLRDSSNLPSFGVVYLNDLGMNKMLNQNSSFCLLYGLVKILRFLNQDKYSQEIFQNPELKFYLEKVNSSMKSFDYNIFEQIELNFISEIILLANDSAIDQSMFDYNLLNIGLSVVTLIDDQSIRELLIENILFNKKFYDMHLINKMSNLNINQANEQVIVKALHDLDGSKQVYKKITNFKSIDWIFDPLIISYKNKDAKLNSEELIKILNYIFLIVDRHQLYLKRIFSSPSTIFALISTVFLISNELFLESSVQQILYHLLNSQLFKDMIFHETDTIPHFGVLGDL